MVTSNYRRPRHNDQSRNQIIRRRGAIVVLAAFLMILMMGMMAFSLDVGMIATGRAEIQRATDAGVLAGAAMLGSEPERVEEMVREYIQQNSVGGRAVPDEAIQVEIGTWDNATRQFIPGGDSPTAVRVQTEQTDQPFFFAGFLGRRDFSIQGEAIAVFRPRDIMVILDLSGSMNDDSELKHISKLGRAAIENNLKTIHEQLGGQQYGTLPWKPRYISSNNNSAIKKYFGLDKIAYPYPSGSWDDYINYIKSNGNIQRAGYRRSYGLMTLVNYWLERQPGHDQTPDLWQADAQPVTAVKDAVSVFLAYLQEVQASDQVGLSVYTSADGTGQLESPLTKNMQRIEQLSRERQAGHYHVYTNISAGMQKAREELEEHGRSGAQKMMVLLTDGIANRPSNQSVARQRVREEADLAAQQGFPVVTISLGSSADIGLMQAVADTTGGYHFNVPGGSGVADYEDDLKDVFRDIAGNRSLMLVK